MQNGSLSDSTQINYLQFEDLGRKWAGITVVRLKSSLQAKKVGKTMKLLTSFTYSVSTGNGEYLKILITYLYYGIFTDMGVGKGITLSMALAGHKFKRKRKVWYSSTIAKETAKLSFFMAAKAGSQAGKILLDFPTRVEM